MAKSKSKAKSKPVEPDGNSAAAAPTDTAAEPADPAARSDSARQVDVSQLLSSAHSALLPGVPEFTFVDVAARLNVEPTWLRGVWVALGYPDPLRVRTDGAEVWDTSIQYSEIDLAVLRSAVHLISSGIIAPDTVIPVARSLGQAMARLAEWEAGLMIGILNTIAAGESVPAQVTPESLIGHLHGIQDHIWRRHLSSALAAQSIVPSQNETTDLVVGFADMVGFTRLSRGLAIGELNILLEVFESTTTRIVTTNGGHVVKMVGDEVMFSASDPAQAAEISLQLNEIDRHPEELRALEVDLPELRIGVAAGPVLVRYGDAFGDTVNLASRLTSGARPGTILVNDDLAAALAESAAYQTRRLRPYRARGIAQVHPHLLRRA